MNTAEAIARMDWPSVGRQLDQEGHAIVTGLLSERQVRDLAALCGQASVDHEVSRAPAQPGHGDLFCFSRELPPLMADLRARLYQHLAPIANRWSDALGASHGYPDTLDAFLAQNREAGQTRLQSSMSRLREGDYQPLHQRNEGERVFPLQLVGLLSEPGRDFTGGEFVMTEQRPRMQSRPMVLPLHKADMAVIAVAQRPHKGAKGYYRVNLRHAISRVRSGQRIGLELLLHDAKPR
jgi:hypothetical protein